MKKLIKFLMILTVSWVNCQKDTYSKPEALCLPPFLIYTVL